ncbi:unnamed protein product [Rotaria sp. Silwood2]|nr:unnamed protein product [Rotaria sp. Silwood2]
MNSTLFHLSSTMNMNSSNSNFESWFIPIDIINIICNSLIIGLSFIFLFLLILDKTCHTIPMMLTGNSCLSAFIFGCCMLSMCLRTFQNDRKKIQYQDLFCVFRAYITYVSCFLFNNSFLLQATYRYFTVIYRYRLYFQSIRFHILVICLTWIFALLFPIPFVFTGQILYNVDNQICQIYLRLSISMIIIALWVYGIPITLIIIVYFKLLRYVHGMSNRITPVTTLFRAKRELKMVERILILVAILVVLGLPYALFTLMSFFTSPPKYHFRIAYLFVHVSLVFVMMTLFHFTEPLKLSMMKKIKRRSNITRNIT